MGWSRSRLRAALAVGRVGRARGERRGLQGPPLVAAQGRRFPSGRICPHHPARAGLAPGIVAAGYPVEDVANPPHGVFILQ